MSEQPYNAETVWQTAYGELQLQMPRETFDMWLRAARLIAHEDGTFIIGVQNTYAREWLEHRLKKVILRTLGQIARRTVEVRFVLWSEQPNTRDLYEAGPLLASLAPSEPEPAHFERLSPGETGLNPRQTFDNYAVGSNNRLARAAASEVIENPGLQFNPLYVHAGVGMGKSHLLHAIGNACVEAGHRLLYVTAETFTNDLVALIKTNKTAEFRAKYRTVNVLLVDDIQFIAGKESTQEEFYHTFNTLYDAGAQIVVASSGPPGEIKKLDNRLSSRFEGGLVVELLPPDFETRVEILRLKAQMRGYDAHLMLEVLETIAAETTGSVRDLEGAFNRVIAASLLSDAVPSVAMVEDVLEYTAHSDAPQATLTIEEVISAVAEFYNIDLGDLRGRSRSREVSTARQVAMYIARDVADIPLQQIGDALGGRNHSTVLYSCERIADLTQTDSLIRRQVNAIRQMLKPQQIEENL